MELIGTLKGHISGIYKLVVENDLLYSASGDGMLAAWDLKTFDPAPFSVKVGMPIYSVTILENLMLIGQGQGGIHVIDRETKQEIRHLKYHEKGVFDILYNSESNHFYSTGGGGSLSVFDGDDFSLLIQIPLSDGKLRRLLLTEDKKHLIVSASDGSIHVLDTSYFNQLQSIHGHTGGTYALAWSSGGQQLITGGRDAHLRFWNFSPDALQQTVRIPAHLYAIYDIVNLSENSFATASRDRTVKIWNMNNLGYPLRLHSDRPTTHANSVNALCRTKDKLFTAGDDKLIRIWNIDSLNVENE